MPFNGSEEQLSIKDMFEKMNDVSFKADGYSDTLSKEVNRQINDVYTLVCDYLADSKIVDISARGKLKDQRNVMSLESFNSEYDPAASDRDGVAKLVESAGVPDDLKSDAIKAVNLLLAKFAYCQNDNSLFRELHFSHAKEAENRASEIRSTMEHTYDSSLWNAISNIGMPSQEAFGVATDRVLPDIRSSLTVTLLQFCRGFIDRIMHRRTSDTPYVKYTVPYAEVYDMLKTNDKDHNVRNNEGIIPFINLYQDPKAVSNALQPIVPLLQNAESDEIYSDGFIKINRRANIFDAARLADKLGYSHTNWTDLVSENVLFDSVLVQLTKGNKTEIIQIPLINYSDARFNMRPNIRDSGERAGLLKRRFALTSATKTVENAPSELLAKCTNNDYIELRIVLQGDINLKYGDVETLGNNTIKTVNRLGESVAPDVVTAADGLTAALLAVSIDARYSEENLRKSNLAVRSNVRTLDYEISNGRNVMVDYSIQQEVPDFIMPLVNETISLGQDHRALDVIVRQLLHVYDEVNAEATNPELTDRLEKIGFEYAASQKVRPTVYLNTIDLSNVDTIRSSDILGDIRQYVEWQLMNLVALTYQNSLYKHEIERGETPKFKVLTSSVILETILAIPHIHEHLYKNEKDAAPAETEYQRVLPNGTILDCVTTTFNSVRDKIIMIPYRDNAPESELNFGHNHDYGMFIAHYNPQIENSVNKRLYANARTMVITTNVVGLYLTVTGLDQFINMFATGSAQTIEDGGLPSVADLIIDVK